MHSRHCPFCPRRRDAVARASPQLWCHWTCSVCRSVLADSHYSLTRRGLMPVFPEGFSSVTSRPAHCIGKTSLRRDTSDDCAQPCHAVCPHRQGTVTCAGAQTCYCSASPFIVCSGRRAVALECALKLNSMVTQARAFSEEQLNERMHCYISISVSPRCSKTSLGPAQKRNPVSLKQCHVNESNNLRK